jgi:hypothetical protein
MSSQLKLMVEGGGHDYFCPTDDAHDTTHELIITSVQPEEADNRQMNKRLQLSSQMSLMVER